MPVTVSVTVVLVWPTRRAMCSIGMPSSDSSDHTWPQRKVQSAVPFAQVPEKPLKDIRSSSVATAYNKTSLDTVKWFKASINSAGGVSAWSLDSRSRYLRNRGICFPIRQRFPERSRGAVDDNRLVKGQRPGRWIAIRLKPARDLDRPSHLIQIAKPCNSYDHWINEAKDCVCPKPHQSSIGWIEANHVARLTKRYLCALRCEHLTLVAVARRCETTLSPKQQTILPQPTYANQTEPMTVERTRRWPVGYQVRGGLPDGWGGQGARARRPGPHQGPRAWTSPIYVVPPRSRSLPSACGARGAGRSG